MNRDRSVATYSEHEAQRILARAAELEGVSGTRFTAEDLRHMYLALKHSLRGGLSGLLRELGVVLGAFTLAIIASEGVRNASPAITWSLVCGALGTAILSLRSGARVIIPTASDSALTDKR